MTDLRMFPEVIRAAEYAMRAHGRQRRKYSHDPYWVHLHGVADLVADVPGIIPEAVVVAWLHDTVEDTPTTIEDVSLDFGPLVGAGVDWLTCRKIEPRAAKLAGYNRQLSMAPGWVQTVKVADIINNGSTIRKAAPHYAEQYLGEKRDTLAVLGRADETLLARARVICAAGG